MGTTSCCRGLQAPQAPSPASFPTTPSPGVFPGPAPSHLTPTRHQYRMDGRRRETAEPEGRQPGLEKRRSGGKWGAPGQPAAPTPGLGAGELLGAPLGLSAVNSGASLEVCGAFRHAPGPPCTFGCSPSLSLIPSVPLGSSISGPIQFQAETPL